MADKTFKEIALERCDKRTAEEIATEICGLLTNNKSNDDVVTIPFEYGCVGYGIRPFGNGCEERKRRGECYTLNTMKVMGKEYCFDGLLKVEMICKAIKKKVEISNITTIGSKTYSGKNTVVTMCEQYEGYNFGPVYSTISNVVVINKVSKEFVKLQKYLVKHANFKLTETMCYFVPTFGKRGVYEENPDNRRYFCTEQYASVCADFLKLIKSTKGTNDTLAVNTVVLNDEEDKEYSMYHETECYGSKRYTIVCVITTPKGKRKLDMHL